MINKKLVGQRIKEIRIQNGKTQEQFGNLFSASKGNVAMWEKGSTLPNKNRLLEIAILANKDINELLYGDLSTYLFEHLDFTSVIKFFEDFNEQTKQNIIEMLESFVPFYYESDFNDLSYDNKLNVCQRELKASVLFFIKLGSAAIGSFKQKDIKILEENKNVFLVDLFLNNEHISNNDFITSFRFLVGYNYDKFLFPGEILHSKNPFDELSNIINEYYKGDTNAKDLYDRLFYLGDVLIKAGYEDDKLGNAILNFIENEFEPILLERIPDNDT